MNLLIPIAIWVVLALIVIVLAFYRYGIARRDDGLVHVADSEARMAAEQAVIAKRLDVLDRWGKSLTVVVVLFGLVLAGIYMYNIWNEMGNIRY